MNILAYILFCLAMTFFIVRAGQGFYANGWIFLHYLFKGDDKKAAIVNQLLLSGYYLINIGYTLLQIRSWPSLKNSNDLILSISCRAGLLIVMLAVLHYLNMGLLWLAVKKKTPQKF